MNIMEFSDILMIILFVLVSVSGFLIKNTFAEMKKQFEKIEHVIIKHAIYEEQIKHLRDKVVYLEDRVYKYINGVIRRHGDGGER